MTNVSSEDIAKLASAGYFERVESPACVAILPDIKPNFTGVEIGVYMGTSSTVFLDNCAFMHLIDPCVEYAQNPDKGYFTRERPVLNLFQPYEGRFKFIKGFSADVVDMVPQVDFVFIDGNHTYNYVKKDIALYWPKVKSGGFLSGHDYTRGHPGVTMAVDRFSKKLGLPVEIHQYCWMIKKP